MHVRLQMSQFGSFGKCVDRLCVALFFSWRAEVFLEDLLHDFQMSLNIHPPSLPKIPLTSLACLAIDHSIPQTKICGGTGPCEVVPGCSARSTTTCHTGVPQSSACEHGEEGHAGEVRCRGSEITPATHFPAEMSSRILERTSGFVRSYLDQTSCGAHGRATSGGPSYCHRDRSTPRRRA